MSSLFALLLLSVVAGASFCSISVSHLLYAIVKTSCFLLCKASWGLSPQEKAALCEDPHIKVEERSVATDVQILALKTQEV